MCRSRDHLLPGDKERAMQEDPFHLYILQDERIGKASVSCQILLRFRMAATILYMLPMLLGRTFNETSSKVGIDIFPKSAIDGAETIVSNKVKSTYKVIKNSQDARDFLDVSGEISLRVKAGLLKIDGTGSYLKDSKSRNEYVEILAKSNFETKAFTLPSSSKPNNDWFLQSSSLLGTHYVRSIIYGGELIASIKFKSSNQQDREKIAATVDASLKAGGSLAVNLKGKFNKLENKLKTSSSLEIKYFATVNLKTFPTTIDELIDLAQSFPDQVKLINDGLGVPIRAELVPLSQFKDNYPQFLRNRALESALNELEDKFDDVRTAIFTLDQWSRGLTLLSPTQERRISEFNTELYLVNAAFIDVISNLDVSLKGTKEQFKPALDLYLSGKGLNLPGKYYSGFKKLKREIEAELFDTAPRCVRGFNKIENRLLRMSLALYSIKHNVQNLARCRQICRNDVKCRSLTFMKDWSKYVARRSQWVAQSNKCYINRVTSLQVPGYDIPTWMKGRFYIMDRC